MKQNVIDFLIETNNTFYNENFLSFSRSRSLPWNGWVEAGSVLNSHFSNMNKIKILDLAAGNGRFIKYILDNFDIVVDALMVDSSTDLLGEFSRENEKNSQIEKINIDIIKSLLVNKIDTIKKDSFDLSVSFGFFHHVPSFDLRKKLLELLINATKNEGFVFISFWNFTKTFIDEQKYIRQTKKFLCQTCFNISDLDYNDYLIGWKNTNSFRYCHSFSTQEINSLLKNFTNNISIIKNYYHDGKTQNNNHYLLLKIKK